MRPNASFTNEHGGGNPSLVDGRQLEVALGRRQQEGDAKDLDGIAGIGDATRHGKPEVKAAETCGKIMAKLWHKNSAQLIFQTSNGRFRFYLSMFNRCFEAANRTAVQTVHRKQYINIVAIDNRCMNF